MKQIRYALIGACLIAAMIGVVALVRIYAVLPSGSVLPTPEVSPDAAAGIVVEAPQPNAVVQNPIQITGTVTGGGWFFEGVFPVRLATRDGIVVVSEPARALSDWMSTGTVAFDATVSYVVATDTPMILLLHNDNASGLARNDRELRIPVVLKGQETMRVNAFWRHESPNFGGMPNDYNCSDVVASERIVARTAAPARAALESLLAGPTVSEGQIGLFTNINQGVKIKKLSIQNNTAYVDFDATLGQGVAGSCRVTAIRAQITKTLEQFSTIKNVVISIDGRVQDILQP